MAERAFTPNAVPIAGGWRSWVRPTALKLTLLVTFFFTSIRAWELGRSESLLPVLKTFEHALGDLRFRERLALHLERQPEHVVIVAADEKSVGKIGLWPWPRTVYADLITKLTKAGVRSVVFDIGFIDEGAQMDAKGNAVLAQAVKDSGKTVQAFLLLDREGAADMAPDEIHRNEARLEKAGAAVGRAVAPKGNGFSPPVPAVEASLRAYPAARAPIDVVAAASTWFGYFNAEPDDDGTLRRTRLLSRLGDHLTLPSIDVAGFGITCGAPAPRLIRPLGATEDAVEISAIDMPCKDGDRLVPVEERSDMLLDYHVPWARMPRVSAVDVIDGKVAAEQLSGKIALIAATAVGTWDLRSSPLDSEVPGGVTHAVALEQMMRGRYLERPLWLVVAELLLLVMLGLGFGKLFSILSPLRAAIATVGGMALTHGVTLGLFLAGYDVVSALPQVELLVLAVTVLVFRYLTDEKEKRYIRSAFGHYLTPSVMEAVLADPKKLRLGGEKRDLTVLFSDVRGFTSLSEKLQPEQLVTLLNQYLTPMTDLVFEHGGTLDKYMGDAIMAFFGAPIDQPDHALRAVKTADAMMKKLDELTQEWAAQKIPALDIGIGVSSGPMVVGNMGSANGFRNYTVMGDVVNLGSRLEGTNKVYGTHVIIAEDTEQQVRDHVTTRLLDSVRVKGKKQPVRIYELISIGPPPEAWLRWLDDYQIGIHHYRQRDFDQALAAFERVLQVRPHDKAAELHIERCRVLRATPPPDSWDGVSDLLTK